MASEEFNKFEGAVPHERGGLVLGERDGILIGIDDVSSGLACGCICPNPLCAAPLVAKKCKPGRMDHFAHYKRRDCGVALETALHKAAKAILEEARQFEVPAYTEWFGDQEEVLLKGRCLQFDEVRLEQRTGRIVPDVILIKDGHELIVELVVTHWCDQTKIDILALQGLACVEVDLSRYREVPSLHNLREIVIRSAPREWLNNPVGVLRAQKREAELIAEAQDRAATREALIVKVIGSFERIGPETNFPNAVDVPEFVDKLGLNSLLNISIFGDQCLSNRLGWQLCVLEAFVHRSFMAGPSASAFSTKDVHEKIKAFRRQGFPNWIDEDIRADVLERLPQYRSSFDVAKAYLEVLQGAGILQFRKGWSLSANFRLAVGEREWLKTERARRRDEVRDLARDIIRSIPKGERMGFDYDRWLQMPFIPGSTINDVIRCDPDPDDIDDLTPEYRTLTADLSALRDMFAKSGPIPKNMLFFPLHASVQRIKRDRHLQALAAEAERQRRVQAEEQARIEAERKRLENERLAAIARQEQERQNGLRRLAAFRTRLAAEFPCETFGDLERALVIAGQPAVSLVQQSDRDGERVEDYLTELSQIGALTGERKRRLAAASRQLYMLSGVAKDRPRAMQFLTTFNPAYGARPIDLCLNPDVSNDLREKLYSF
ncbi:hypothetical protein [Asticcacaulis sp. W401b]|uniref:hypothetical protein n=1 Tax=Asticcacaulis sp. W401b TaxID=3388666 RepID=UPI003970DF69